MLPVYFGRRYRSTVTGQIWRPVICDHCGYGFAYQMTIKATGSGSSPYMLDNSGAQQRAQDSARRAAEKKAKTAQANVPCPQCGRYHSGMIANHQRYWRSKFYGVAIGLALVVATMFNPAVAAIGLLLGVAVLVVYLVMRRRILLVGGGSTLGLILLHEFLKSEAPAGRVPITLVAAAIPMAWAAWRGFVENLNADPEKNKRQRRKYPVVALQKVKPERAAAPDTATTA